MLKFLIALTFIFLGSSVFADCKDCMAHCPHTTKDIKDCDRGCPGVCDQTKCVSCMSQCPHKSRDIKPCDLGCPTVCSGQSGVCVAVGRAAFDTKCNDMKFKEGCESGAGVGASCSWRVAEPRSSVPTMGDGEGQRD